MRQGPQVFCCASEFIPSEPFCMISEIKYRDQFQACRQSLLNYTNALDQYYRCSEDKLKSLFDQLLISVPAKYNCYEEFFKESKEGDPSNACPPIDVPRYMGSMQASGLKYNLGVPRCISKTGTPKRHSELWICKSQVEVFTGKGSRSFLGASSAQDQYDTFLENLRRALDEKAEAAGVADYFVTKNGYYTMSTRTKLGLLEVTAIYDGSDKTPDQLKVKVTFDKEPTATLQRLLSKSDVDTMFVEAMKDMSPEYSVFGYMNRSDSSPVENHFTIVKKGLFPEIDLINKKGKACFTSCINPAKSHIAFNKNEQRFGGFIKYKNKKYGFQFQYPESWNEINPSQATSVKVIVKNCPLCGHQETFNVAVEKTKNKLEDIDEFKEQLVALMRTIFQDVEIIGGGKVNVGGGHGNYFLINYTLRKGGKSFPRILKQIYIDRGGYFYTLSLGSNPDYQSLVKPVFKEIINSFKFSKIKDSSFSKANINEDRGFPKARRSYWDNGKVKVETHYLNKKKQGSAIMWYENGNKQREALFNNDKREGLTTSWYESGEKWGEAYYENGIQQGLATLWYESGKKKTEINYKDGKPDGISNQWYESGVKERKAYYKKGKIDGIGMEWYKSGRKKVESHYKNGTPDGLGTTWYESGKLQSNLNYKNGKPDGLITVWYESGGKMEERHYKNGMMNGLKTKWDKDGKKKYERMFQDGIEQ